MNKSRKTNPPLEIDDPDRIAFHMAEFSALKAEIADLVKVASSSLQYALAVAGAITVWLVSAKTPTSKEQLIFQIEPEYLRCAFFLPFLLTVFFGTLALAAYIRIGEKGSYLKELEDHFRAGGLGWESRLERRPPMLGALYGVAWGGLTIFTLIVAWLGV